VNTVSSHNRLETRTVIGIFGHYGNENLGDEAIIDALILRIRKDPPNAEIRCFSIHPETQQCDMASLRIRSVRF